MKLLDKAVRRLLIAWFTVRYHVGRLLRHVFSRKNYQMTMLWFSMALVVGGLFQLNTEQRDDDQRRADGIARVVEVAITDRIEGNYVSCVRGNELRLNIRKSVAELGATPIQQAVFDRRFKLVDCEGIRDKAVADSPTEARPEGGN